jgi:FkbM family methyltransferase
MRTLLRKRLTEWQYSRLRDFKTRFLPDPLFQLFNSPFWIIGPLIRLIPGRSRVAIKSKINVVRRMDYKPRKIFLNIDSDFEYRVRLNSSVKEPETVNWIETLFKPGQVMYDIGANVGAYSLIASRFFDGKLKVYAFEPAFQNYNQLCKNLALNHCDDSVVPLQVALSGSTGIETFNYHNLVPGSAVHALGDPVNHLGETFAPALRQPALTYRADDFISQFKIALPNHIKIDVDGIEFELMQGFDKTLDGPSVESILLELNEERGHRDELLGYLVGKGFELKAKYDRNHILVRKS